MAQLIAVLMVILLISAGITVVIYAVQSKQTQRQLVAKQHVDIPIRITAVFLADGESVDVDGEMVIGTDGGMEKTAVQIICSEAVETAVRHIVAHKTQSELEQNPNIISLKVSEAIQDQLNSQGLKITSLKINFMP